MKNKLKFIIPIVIAVIAIIIAALCINFTPQEMADVSSLMSTAQKYLIENQYEQAIAEFNKVIEIEPKNVDAYIGLAEAYVGMGDTEKAVEILEKGYVLTGDERLKNMIDELNSENSVAEVTTVASKTETEVTAEESKLTEQQITYCDDWYSIFRYDENENIVSMSLYNKSGVERLGAKYEYSGDNVKRTVYLDGVFYDESIVTFTDIMADIEKEKKERANTREEYGTNWFVYDENGELTEHGWHNFDANGNPTDDSGEEIYYKNGIEYKSHSYFISDYGWAHTTYYDEKGYPIRQEGEEYSGGYSQENNITYTYENDNNGYPVIQFENSDILNNEKSREYVNFYRDDKFVGSAYHNLEIIIESDNHSYKRYGYHGSNLKETDDKGLLLRDIDDFNYYNRYYIPSFDGTKMIDMIYIDYRDKHLFECPYCNE